MFENSPAYQLYEIYYMHFKTKYSGEKDIGSTLMQIHCPEKQRKYICIKKTHNKTNRFSS
jgi:hypothetical protein